MVGICPRCKKEISTIRKIKWKWFALCLLLGIVLIISLGLSLVSLLLGMIPALIYVFYYFTKAPKACPICGYSNIYDKEEGSIKEKTSHLEDRMLYLDEALKNPNKISQQEKEKLTKEIHEVAEELRKCGYEGSLEETRWFKTKKRKY